MFLQDRNLCPMPVEVAGKPYTLGHFIAWIETRDPNETYNWRDCRGDCLIGQYARHIGDEDPYYAVVNKFIGLSRQEIQPIASSVLDSTHPYTTFGKALARARAFRDSRVSA